MYLVNHKRWITVCMLFSFGHSISRRGGSQTYSSKSNTYPLQDQDILFLILIWSINNRCSRDSENQSGRLNSSSNACLVCFADNLYLHVNTLFPSLPNLILARKGNHHDSILYPSRYTSTSIFSQIHVAPIWVSISTTCCLSISNSFISHSSIKIWL